MFRAALSVTVKSGNPPRCPAAGQWATVASSRQAMLHSDRRDRLSCIWRQRGTSWISRAEAAGHKRVCAVWLRLYQGQEQVQPTDADGTQNRGYAEECGGTDREGRGLWGYLDILCLDWFVNMVAHIHKYNHRAIHLRLAHSPVCIYACYSSIKQRREGFEKNR